MNGRKFVDGKPVKRLEKPQRDRDGFDVLMAQTEKLFRDWKSVMDDDGPPMFDRMAGFEERLKRRGGKPRKPEVLARDKRIKALTTLFVYIHEPRRVGLAEVAAYVAQALQMRPEEVKHRKVLGGSYPIFRDRVVDRDFMDMLAPLYVREAWPAVRDLQLITDEFLSSLVWAYRRQSASGTSSEILSSLETAMRSRGRGALAAFTAVRSEIETIARWNRGVRRGRPKGSKANKRPHAAGGRWRPKSSASRRFGKHI